MSDRNMTDLNAEFREMDKWLIDIGATFFKDIDSQSDAFGAIGYLLNKISGVMQQIEADGNLNQEQTGTYSFASCGVEAILQTLQNNPIFDEGVLSDQAMHNYRIVLAGAKHAEIDPKRKGG